jgi:hypothetical protein
MHIILHTLLGSSLSVKSLTELSIDQLREAAGDLKAALFEIESEAGYRESVTEVTDEEIHNNEI